VVPGSYGSDDMTGPEVCVESVVASSVVVTEERTDRSTRELIEGTVDIGGNGGPSVLEISGGVGDTVGGSTIVELTGVT